jgi:hypothetical protein
LPNPELKARDGIDRLLVAAGWSVHGFESADLYAAPGNDVLAGEFGG